MSPEPWTCNRCGQRVQWRRTAVVCLQHGVLSKLTQPAPAEPQGTP